LDNDEIPLDFDDATAGGFDADFAAEGNANSTNSASTHYMIASARHTKALTNTALPPFPANHACR
jgi:hypothetical protein